MAELSKPMLFAVLKKMGWDNKKDMDGIVMILSKELDYDVEVQQ